MNEATRPDVNISAKLGFKQVNNQLLRKVEIRFKQQIIRSYELTYGLGAFKKSLLKEISQFDADGNLFYKNKLEYYDDIRDVSGNYNPFGPLQSWTVQNDNLLNSSIPNQTGYSNKHSLLASSNGNSSGFNFRLGLGLVFDLGKFKGSTIGAHGGSTNGVSESVVMLEDIDGDNLPDKIFNENGTIFYRKNLYGTGQNGFGELRQINISNIGFTKSSSFNWGVDLTLAFGPSLTVGFDNQSNRSTTKSYFMDFNSDGLLDFADNGKVYYNRLVLGVPTFIENSTATPAPVSGGGTLLLTGPTSLITPADLKSKNPLHDVVRMWEAPVTGQISVSHNYNLVQDPSLTRQNYKTNAGLDKADGVHLYFQKSGQLIWDETITAIDYSIKTRLNQNLNVVKGDKLYFRVSSIEDGNFDKVNWNPIVTYNSVIQSNRNASNVITTSSLNVPNLLVDSNLYSLKNYNATSDFFCSTSVGVTIPSAGNILFTGILNKPVTSDHVLLKIYKKLNGSTNELVIYQNTFLAKDIVNFDLATVSGISVEALSQVRIVLETATNIKWQDVTFIPFITLPPQNGGTPETKKIEVSHVLLQKRLGNYIINGEIPTINGLLNLSINPTNYVLSNTGSILYDGEIIVSAKQQNKLVARKRYMITNGILSPLTNLFDQQYGYENVVNGIPINLEITSVNSKSIDIIRNYPLANALNIELLIPNPLGVNWTSITDNYSVYSKLNPRENELSLTHRNWGGFVINGTLANNTIIESQTGYSNSYLDSSTTNPDINNTTNPNLNGYNISDEYFVGLSSIYSENSLLGLENSIFIKENLIGSARLGEDDISQYLDTTLPILVGGQTATLDMINESSSNSVSAGAGFGPVNGGASSSNGSSQTTQTMADFNGDGFPDYIRGANVQFTTPRGGVHNQLTNIGQFNNSITTSGGANVGGAFSHGAAKNSSQSSLFRDRKSTRLNSSHRNTSRMPSSA